MDPSRVSQVKHLFEVEHLTVRQIARELRMCPKTISRIITGKGKRKTYKPKVLAPYLRLIDEWYASI
jgi:IS30 family transposase